MKKILFFDTETTGLPSDFNLPRYVVDNWPRLVQLSWTITDENGNRLKTADHIIRPSGFDIPKASADIHGITTDIAMQIGDDLTAVITDFMDDYKSADLIVGHNIDFDKNVVGAEIIRLGMKDFIDSKPSICTMKSSTDYCALPNKKGYGYKYPNLQELHRILFGHNFENAHNSASDIDATEKCFWKLQQLGVIQIAFNNS